MNPSNWLRNRLVEDTKDDPTNINNSRNIEQLLDVSVDQERPETTRRDQYLRTLDLAVLAPMRIAWMDWRARLGISILLGFAFMALIWAPMYPPTYRNTAPIYVQPFNGEYMHTVYGIRVWQYPLGTDGFGRPILQRIVNAAPAMGELVVAGAVVSIGVAVLLGVTAGYKGGTIDSFLSGIIQVVMVIPGFPLVLLLTAIFTPKDPFVLGVILAIDNWPGLSMALRSQVLTIREESYVEASRAMGISTGGILGKDIVPQLMPYVMINAAGAGKRVIMEAVGLYFLGLLPGGAPNWGKMLNIAYEQGAVGDLNHFYWIFWPMLVLALLSFGLVMLAQGLDRVFNPRLRARYAKRIGNDDKQEKVRRSGPP